MIILNEKAKNLPKESQRNNIGLDYYSSCRDMKKTYSYSTLVKASNNSDVFKILLIIA